MKKRLVWFGLLAVVGLLEASAFAIPSGSWCPKGFEPDGSNNQCKINDRDQFKPKCPGGYTYTANAIGNQDGCLKMGAVTIRPTCPDYDPPGGVGKIKPHLQTTSKNEDNCMYFVSPRILACEAGYKLENEQCVHRKAPTTPKTNSALP